MQRNTSGNTFIEKRTKTGVGGSRAWSWCGGEKGGASYERGKGLGLEIFDDLLGKGSEPFLSHHKKCITSLPLQLQIVFFSAKRHSQNNYSSISDYFL